MADETVWQRDRRIRNAVLTMGQTFYLVTLNQFVGNNSDAWPKQNTIAHAMNASDRAVRNWQSELEALGIIQVEAHKGRSLTNRYRLNLSALKQKQEARSGFTNNSEAKPGTTFLPKQEPRSGENRNHVPTERTAEKTKKEQGNAIPENLDTETFRYAWGEWLEYRNQRKQSLTPATIGKQLKKLSAWGPVVAVQAIEQSIEHGWQGLFEPKQNTKSAGDTEAEQVWQTVLGSIKRSRFKPDEIRTNIGELAWQVVKSIGGVKRIDEANGFDLRELKEKFIQDFNKQGAVA